MLNCGRDFFIAGVQICLGIFLNLRGVFRFAILISTHGLHTRDNVQIDFDPLTTYWLLRDNFLFAESENNFAEIFGVGDDNGRRRVETCASEFLRLERQDNLPALNRVANCNTRFESLADKLARVQPDVNQEFDAAKRFQADNAGRRQKFNRAVERRENFSVGILNRNATTRRAARKNFIVNFVQRN